MCHVHALANTRARPRRNRRRRITHGADGMEKDTSWAMFCQNVLCFSRLVFSLRLKTPCLSRCLFTLVENKTNPKTNKNKKTRACFMFEVAICWLFSVFMPDKCRVAQSLFPLHPCKWHFPDSSTWDTGESNYYW